FDALKETPVVADTTAVEKMMKVVTAVGRATLTVRAVKAAEDKLAEDKAGRLNKLEQMKMDEFTPDELEQRAAELRARADRILALIEAKCPKVGHDSAERDRALDGGQPRRAA
ncbi:MAG TPA: hypothetical protein VFX95_06410, partial [Caulobacteraceae bacterium]|nr:hypothetical protein [Caulobacteraceae bacterium]